MITPMLGAHSIECVNFIHCNLNNQFCQQEIHKQLSMDFLSIYYIVDELLVDGLQLSMGFLLAKLIVSIAMNEIDTFNGMST